MPLNINNIYCNICDRELNHQVNESVCQSCMNNILPFNHLTNEAISDLFPGNIHVDPFIRLNELAELNFNPQLMNDEHNQIFSDIDPDLNYLNDQCNFNCNYFDEDQLNTKSKLKQFSNVFTTPS